MPKELLDFNSLPDELQISIASYLDTPSLCFFASTSKRSLKNAYRLLLEHQKNHRTTIKIDAFGVGSIVYTQNKVYMCGYGTGLACGIQNDSEGSPVSPSTGIQIDDQYANSDDNKIALTTLLSVEDLPGTILQVVHGSKHVMVLTTQGIYAWGDNQYGQLGLPKYGPTESEGEEEEKGNQQNYGSEFDTFTSVKSPPGIIKRLIAGNFCTFAIIDQELYACGINLYGELGLGHTENCDTFTRAKGLAGEILQVLPTNDCTLVVTDQGLYTCGKNKNGELGLGDSNPYVSFTKVENLSGKILQAYADPGEPRDDFGSSCKFILTEEGLYTNIFLVDTFTLIKNLPGKIQQIEVRFSKVWVLTDQGLYLYVPESDFKSQLRPDYTDFSAIFTQIKELPGTILQVAVRKHSILVWTDQGLYGRGSNKNGELGLGKKTTHCETFTKVSNLPGKILQLTVAESPQYPSYFSHTLVLTDQGLYVCGSNFYGQLGLSHDKNRFTFNKVSRLPTECKKILSLYCHIEQLKAINENQEISLQNKKIKFHL